MDKPGMRPPPPPFDPVSYMIGTILPRLEALERKFARWESKLEQISGAATTYGKRSVIIAAVWTLALLVNAFPGSTVAHYAEALRLALIR